MTQEMWWIVLAASGLLVPMLVGLLPVARRVPVRVQRGSHEHRADERR